MHRKTRGTWARRVGGLALAGLLLGATGCDLSLFRKTRGCLFDYNVAGKVKVQAKAIKYPVNVNFKNKATKAALEALSVYAKKDDSPSYGFVQTNHDLWGDFQVGISVGQFDSKLPLTMSPGFACLELDGRDTSPLEYYGNCVQFYSGGAQVFATMRGNSNLGTLDLPGATAVDLRIETSGGTLWYLARPFNTGEFQMVASTSIGTPSFGLMPSVGGNNIAGKTGFSFLNPVMDLNGSPPPRETTEDEIADLLDDADEDIWDACFAILFGFPGDARALVEEAEGHLADARDLADTLPDSKETRRLKKDIEKAGGGLDHVTSDMDKEKPDKKIQKGLSKSLTKSSSALWMVRPLIRFD